jgi:hypothetical protein
LRLRLRYRDLSTHWFDYLVCSPDELAGLVKDGPWRLADVDDADAPIYLATLALAPETAKRRPTGGRPPSRMV